MTIAAQVARAGRELELNARAGDFCALARALARTKGGLGEAMAEPRLTDRVQAVLKSAILAGGLTDADFVAVGGYRVIADGFLESLRQQSAFDTVLPFAKSVPPQTTVEVSTVALTGQSPAEKSAKRVNKLSISAVQLAPRKAVAQIVASQELVRLGSPNAGRLFDAELRAGVVAATDSTFISALIALTTPTASAGATTANIYADIATLLGALSIGANSHVFLILHPTRAKSLLTKTAAGGNVAFPAFTLSGGPLVGDVVGLVSDQISTSAVLALVAEGLVGSSTTITLSASDQATLQLEDASPDSPPTSSTSVVSLFQHDLTALLAERVFCFAVARAASVASLSGVSW